MVPSALAPRPAVLVVVEDASLAELLVDALDDAGHVGVVADGPAAIEAALRSTGFHTAIVDLDTRSLPAVEIARGLREKLPEVKLIVLLPCGGIAPPVDQVPYHLAVAKPARLQALLSAVAAAAPSLVQIAK